MWVTVNSKRKLTVKKEKSESGIYTCGVNLVCVEVKPSEGLDPTNLSGFQPSALGSSPFLLTAVEETGSDKPGATIFFNPPKKILFIGENLCATSSFSSAKK